MIVTPGELRDRPHPVNGKRVRRARWADEVYRAGYTVPSLRQAAGTDAGYQEWLAWHARKACVALAGS